MNKYSIKYFAYNVLMYEFVYNYQEKQNEENLTVGFSSSDHFQNKSCFKLKLTLFEKLKFSIGRIKLSNLI